MHLPLGYVDLQSAAECVSGNPKHTCPIDPADDSEFPSVAVYTHSPVDITASVLAKLIIEAESHGHLTADDLRAIYSFMVPAKDEVQS